MGRGRPLQIITCKRCGEHDEVSIRSKCYETGLCSRCQWKADGIMDEQDNWLGKYAPAKKEEPTNG